MKRINSLLYVIAGVLFVAAALIGKNMVFIPIGVCVVILGIVNRKN